MDREALQERLERALAACDTAAIDGVVRRMRIHRILAGVHFYRQDGTLAPIPKHIDEYERKVREREGSGERIDDVAFTNGLHDAIRAGLAEETMSPSDHLKACAHVLGALGGLLELSDKYGFGIDHFGREPPPEEGTVNEYVEHLSRVFRPLEREWKRRAQ